MTSAVFVQCYRGILPKELSGHADVVLGWVALGPGGREGGGGMCTAELAINTTCFISQHQLLHPQRSIRSFTQRHIQTGQHSGSQEGLVADSVSAAVGGCNNMGAAGKHEKVCLGQQVVDDCSGNERTPGKGTSGRRWGKKVTVGRALLAPSAQPRALA